MRPISSRHSCSRASPSRSKVSAPRTSLAEASKPLPSGLACRSCSPSTTALHRHRHRARDLSAPPQSSHTWTEPMSSILALNALNFFMADVRDGLGPFLGVFLQGSGWSPAAIGLVMTIGGYAGMLATTPLGAFVDATRAKRALMIATAIAIVVASTAMLVFPSFLV